MRMRPSILVSLFASNISTPESGFEKLPIHMTDSPDTCEKRVNPQGKIADSKISRHL